MATDNHDARADWAEAMPEFGPETEIFEGDESRAALRDLLAGPPAIGGPEEVTRRLRGRPSLTPGVGPGYRSRQLNVRVGGATEQNLSAYQAATHENASNIVRLALDEFFANHKITAGK